MYDSEYGNTIEGNSFFEAVISEFVEIFNFDVIFFPFNRFIEAFDIVLNIEGIFFPSNKFIGIFNIGRGR